MIFGNYTDKALRELTNELDRAMRHDANERERLLRIASENETAAHALGTRMMAAALVREAVEAEIDMRLKSQEARGR